MQTSGTRQAIVVELYDLAHVPWSSAVLTPCMVILHDACSQKFGQVLDLVPYADSVTKLHGKCHFCEGKSLFSFRVAADDRQVLVGGEDKYVPTCRKHYVELARLRVMHS